MVLSWIGEKTTATIDDTATGFPRAFPAEVIDMLEE